jgi:hypothetical protein
MTEPSPDTAMPDRCRGADSARLHRGRPVPWLTRWTGEHLPGQRIVLQFLDGTVSLRYAAPTPVDRDRRGVLWLREGSAAGTGQPEWAHVNGPRQRLAMRARRCQVCGQHLPPGPVPFLFSRPELAALRRAEAVGAPATTTTPPCCPACWPVATRLCPHLIRHGAVPCQVDDVTAWGAYGDLYTPDGQCHRNQQLSLHDPRLPRLLGKQAIVRLGQIQVLGRTPRGEQKGQPYVFTNVYPAGASRA